MTTLLTATIAFVISAAGSAEEASSAALPPEEGPREISIDRKWQVLSPVRAGRMRKSMRQAAELLGEWSINLAGVEIDGKRLMDLAEMAPDEPFTRVVREGFGRPVDMLDFFYFLDDVLHAGTGGARGKLIWVTGGRARNEGILLHPDDVFAKRPRRYAAKKSTLAVDKPQRPADLPAAADGDLLGPNWSARFKNPETEEEMFEALGKVNKSGTFVARVRSLLEQLRSQGAEVYLTSTERPRERGYLMWGAFILSRTSSSRGVDEVIAKLEDRNVKWELKIPIVWRHPDGWEATVARARAMADAYDVVYATEKGAKSSNHYGGNAIDVVALALPRTLSLTAPDETKETFDLTAASQARDISLSPAVIRWIEKHFSFRKLVSDYPHWNDAAPAK